MAIKGIRLSETKDYISKADSGDAKTVWKLGVLDSDIFDLVCSNDKLMVIGAEAVRFGLKGFENFTDGDGHLVQFKTVSRPVGRYNYSVVADEIMKIIPPEIKSELGAEILKMSKLSEDEAKN